MVNLLGQERVWLIYIARKGYGSTRKGMVAYIAKKKGMVNLLSPERVRLTYLAKKGYR